MERTSPHQQLRVPTPNQHSLTFFEASPRDLKRWLGNGQPVALMVGGPEGLSQQVKELARESWSLSPLTFPHPLVRVIVAEQIYRAWSLLNNHPYHR